MNFVGEIYPQQGDFDMLKLVVFDWDGTLVDSVETIVRAKAILAKKYHVAEPTRAQVCSILGLNFDLAMRRSFPDLDPKRLKQLSQDYHELMQSEAYHAPLFDGAKQMLLSLKDLGLKLAIATSKVRGEFISELQTVGLVDQFDLMVCGGEQGDKPHPQKLTYLLQHFRVSNTEALMVGDTTTDIQFAKNAGVKSAGVVFGAHNSDELKKENPQWLVRNWPELIEIVIALRAEP